MPRLAEITDTEIERINAGMECDGIGVLNGFLNPDELQTLQDFAQVTAGHAGGEYVVLTTGQMRASLLCALEESPEFFELICRVYKLGTGNRPPDGQKLVQTLRCLKGESGLKHSLRFHYDSYILTLLLPIVIPTRGAPGHLILARRRRAVRASYIRNFWDKILLDNLLTQWRLQRVHKNGGEGMREVPLKPGDLYFFWGYRTIHANAACDPENLRATALFHFGDPYRESSLRKFSRGIRWLTGR